MGCTSKYPPISGVTKSFQVPSELGVSSLQSPSQLMFNPKRGNMFMYIYIYIIFTILGLSCFTCFVPISADRFLSYFSWLLFESPSSLLKSPFSKARHGVDPCHFTFCILRCRMLQRSEILPDMGYSNITETAMILMSVALPTLTIIGLIIGGCQWSSGSS